MSSKSEFEEVMSLISQGVLKPVIDEALPLTAIRRAHERLESGDVRGKLVLVP